MNQFRLGQGAAVSVRLSERSSVVFARVFSQETLHTPSSVGDNSVTKASVRRALHVGEHTHANAPNAHQNIASASTLTGSSPPSSLWLLVAMMVTLLGAAPRVFQLGLPR